MSEIDEEKIHFTEEQTIEVEEKDNVERILDIGGGGEGIISQIYEDIVVAIDLSEEELKETPSNESLKIIMDACQLKFLDEQFDTVTSFFTLMYINNKDLNQVFKEVKRVLKPGGKFLIWDLKIPEKTEKDKYIFATRLKVKFKNKSIETGYGTLWEDNEQDIDKFSDLADQNDLEVIRQRQGEQYFYLEIKK
ncbi:MAG: class I SAM-dependent methyltransferase [Halanaerobiales bacterium]